MELAEEGSNLGLGSAGLQGGGGGKKGVKQEKEFRRANRLEGGIGEERRAAEPQPPFPRPDRWRPSSLGFLCAPIFFFFFGYQSGHLIFHFSPNAEPGPSLRQLIEPSLKRFYITYAEEKGKQVHSFLGRLYKINNKRRV